MKCALLVTPGRSDLLGSIDVRDELWSLLAGVNYVAGVNYLSRFQRFSQFEKQIW